MRSIRPGAWVAALALTCIGLTGCASTLKGLACGAPPYVWDPTSELCHDAWNKEASAACCDKEPTGK